MFHLLKAFHSHSLFLTCATVRGMLGILADSLLFLMHALHSADEKCDYTGS